MTFNNPEVLPEGDNQQAMERFQQILDGQLVDERVLFVVLGDSSSATNLVNKAVTLSGTGSIQGVVWAKRPADIAITVNGLDKCNPELKVDLVAPDRAFSLSVSGKITDLIGSSEPEPDNQRVKHSFDIAEVGC